jgi:hypothetical protein
MNGLEFARCLTAGGLRQVLVHAAPSQVAVEVRADDGTLVASGDVDRRAEYTPMTMLTLDGGSVARAEIWPSDAHHGLAVLFAGGEVGVLTAWRHSEERDWWQWSVEFSNHQGRPADWQPPQGRLRR